MLFTIEMEYSVSQFSAKAQSVNCICVPSNGGQEQSPVEPSFFGHTISRDSPLLSMSRGRGRQAGVSAWARNSTGVSVKKINGELSTKALLLYHGPSKLSW